MNSLFQQFAQATKPLSKSCMNGITVIHMLWLTVFYMIQWPQKTSYKMLFSLYGEKHLRTRRKAEAYKVGFKQSCEIDPLIKYGHQRIAITNGHLCRSRTSKILQAKNRMSG